MILTEGEKVTNDYHPTLWRTCRVLANPQRLACLKEVLLRPDSTVEEIAAAAALPHSKTSMGLRALQARGLLRARRHSQWTHYLPHPDPLVPCAKPILAAMRRALVTRPLLETELRATLTAFTHPRRLSILRQDTAASSSSANARSEACFRMASRSPQNWQHSTRTPTTVAMPM